jgi:hypothetical protein
MSAIPTEEDFAKHVGKNFHAKLDQFEGDLKLEEVKSYSAGAGEQDGMMRYSVFFSGPPETFLPQGVYQLNHESIGELELFLVPIAGDQRGFRYEVVFNYFKSEPPAVAGG